MKIKNVIYNSHEFVKIIIILIIKPNHKNKKKLLFMSFDTKLKFFELEHFEFVRIKKKIKKEKYSFEFQGLNIML